VSQEGKKMLFQNGGGGINIVFGPKYRPLTQGKGFMQKKT
jgi:hypothetical protein